MLPPRALRHIARLEAPFAITRQWAALSLAEWPEIEAGLAVRGVLADPDLYVRGAAVRCLAKIPGRQFIPDFVAALRDPAPVVRRAAILALVSFEDEALTPHWCVALRDVDWTVRNIALLVLLKHGGAEAVEPLCGVLPDLIGVRARDNEQVELALWTVGAIVLRYRGAHGAVAAAAMRSFWRDYPEHRRPCEVILKQLAEVVPINYPMPAAAPDAGEPSFPLPVIGAPSIEPGRLPVVSR